VAAQPPLDEVVGAVRLAVSEQHELQLYGIVLVKPGGVLKTSSGKVQRRACREAYAAGTLPVVGQWQQELPSRTADEGVDQPGSLRTQPTREAIQSWLVARLAQRLRVAPQAIDVRQPFAQYGIDSLTAVRLASELQDQLGRPLSATLAYDFPTIEKLAQYLSSDEKAHFAPAPTDDEPAHARDTRAHRHRRHGLPFPGRRGSRAFWQLLRDGREAVGEVPSIRLRDGMGWAAGLNREEGVSRGGFSTAWTCSMPASSASLGVRLKPWTRSSGCCSKWLGELSRMRASHRTDAPAAARACSSASATSTTARWRSTASTPTAFMPARETRPVSLPTGSRMRSTYVVRAGRGHGLFVFAGRRSFRPSPACGNAECDCALAGGVNVILSAQLSSIFAQTGFLAPDARCKTFDDKADGYVRGEGCGLVVLKRLADAQRDGDRILAVLLGSAVNQDGGATVSRLLMACLSKPYSLRHCATRAFRRRKSAMWKHMARGPLSRSIEMDALRRVLAEGRDPSQPCWIARSNEYRSSGIRRRHRRVAAGRALAAARPNPATAPLPRPESAHCPLETCDWVSPANFDRGRAAIAAAGRREFVRVWGNQCARDRGGGSEPVESAPAMVPNARAMC